MAGCAFEDIFLCIKSSEEILFKNKQCLDDVRATIQQEQNSQKALQSSVLLASSELTRLQSQTTALHAQLMLEHRMAQVLHNGVQRVQEQLRDAEKRKDTTTASVTAALRDLEEVACSAHDRLRIDGDALLAAAAVHSEHLREMRLEEAALRCELQVREDMLSDVLRLRCCAASSLRRLLRGHRALCKERERRKIILEKSQREKLSNKQRQQEEIQRLEQSAVSVEEECQCLEALCAALTHELDRLNASRNRTADPSQEHDEHPLHLVSTPVSGLTAYSLRPALILVTEATAPVTEVARSSTTHRNQCSVTGSNAQAATDGRSGNTDRHDYISTSKDQHDRPGRVQVSAENVDLNNDSFAMETPQELCEGTNDLDSEWDAISITSDPDDVAVESQPQSDSQFCRSNRNNFESHIYHEGNSARSQPQSSFSGNTASHKFLASQNTTCATQPISKKLATAMREHQSLNPWISYIQADTRPTKEPTKQLPFKVISHCTPISGTGIKSHPVDSVNLDNNTNTFPGTAKNGSLFVGSGPRSEANRGIRPSNAAGTSLAPIIRQPHAVRFKFQRTSLIQLRPNVVTSSNNSAQAGFICNSMNVTNSNTADLVYPCNNNEKGASAVSKCGTIWNSTNGPQMGEKISTQQPRATVFKATPNSNNSFFNRIETTRKGIIKHGKNNQRSISADIAHISENQRIIKNTNAIVKPFSSSFQMHENAAVSYSIQQHSQVSQPKYTPAVSATPPSFPMLLPPPVTFTRDTALPGGCGRGAGTSWGLAGAARARDRKIVAVAPRTDTKKLRFSSQTEVYGCGKPG